MFELSFGHDGIHIDKDVLVSLGGLPDDFDLLLVGELGEASGAKDGLTGRLF